MGFEMGRMSDPTSMEWIPVHRRTMEKMTQCLKVMVFFSQLKEKNRRVVWSLHNCPAKKMDPVDLNRFFEEDGKLYGYQGLKITIWLSIASFHACGP
ncbi:hypothetical protein Ddye_004840 [Dipteronia dyeriana]|uniref:Histone acetyl transferase HAT1 N-terminal domain-containing protein n=1 Tax=Dipteronia dyeriana TaxID=168575 RepID=A0AAD9XFJ2_9ROSI|nr:hypothetical protein Ddye_004840 [Dipteronia dyeriana]